MDKDQMVLEDNLNEISWTRWTSWTSNLDRKKLAFIGSGVLVLTVICISIGVAVNVRSSSDNIALYEGQFAAKMKLLKDDIRWVSYNSNNYSIVDAFSGGTGPNGKPVYVCRALNPRKSGNKEVMLGTFDPSNPSCVIPFSGKAKPLQEFQLLVTKNQSRLVWHAESNGRIVIGAIAAGMTEGGTELYASRFKYSGYTVLGDLYAPNKVASGAAAGRQDYRADYELLCVADYTL